MKTDRQTLVSPKNPIRLKKCLLFICLLISARSEAQVTLGEWEWVSGDTITDLAPVYGTQLVWAATNMPGNRDSHTGLVDALGRFWLFGGESWSAPIGYTNDLWQYNPTTNLWRWVSGSNTSNAVGVYGTEGVVAATNVPGARYGQVGIMDHSNNIWIFGGDGNGTSTTVGFLNDLWKWNSASNEWTWMSGSNSVNASGVYGTEGVAAATNTPGARVYAATWYDAAGNIWLFGGANGAGYFNDLWKYSPGTGEWTWVSGDNTLDHAGVYGTEGVAAASNLPGARYGMTTAVDASGNFWMFGGFGHATGGATGYLSDLWKYSPSTGEWTWVSGSNTLNNSGVYGTQLFGAAANIPGSRKSGNAYFDGLGNFWLFGGYGYNGIGTLSCMNDLWGYNPVTNRWAWVTGAETGQVLGTYNTEGVPSTTNTPGSRQFTAGWKDASGNFWVQGGKIGTANGSYNDLWKFTILIPLSIKDVELQGVPQGTSILLNWQTLDEVNTTSFVVERSTDGVSFADIGTVAAMGSGDNAYTFTDAHPPAPGNVLYRLKIVSAFGEPSYSPVISFTLTGSGSVSVYPNPATTGVTLQTAGNSFLNTPVKLLDLSGRLISEQVITGQQQYIDLHRVPAGIYLLQLAGGTTMKVVKE